MCSVLNKNLTEYIDMKVIGMTRRADLNVNLARQEMYRINRGPNQYSGHLSCDLA
jgi:hypothetical protein